MVSLQDCFPDSLETAATRLLSKLQHGLVTKGSRAMQKKVTMRRRRPVSVPGSKPISAEQAKIIPDEMVDYVNLHVEASWYLDDDGVVIPILYAVLTYLCVERDGTFERLMLRKLTGNCSDRKTGL